ncbi:putative electron transfer flavoprotein subunit [Aphanomyces cochlioides]|nr:putative electron transfer flavoprotein subunit [Aphanomyces cochlioides]
MGGGLKFLNLKGWHPSNQQNQKRIWIAEQKAKAKEQSERDAAREVHKDNELLRYQQVAATKGDTDAMRRMDAQKVSFMYQAPPGLKKVDEEKEEGNPDDDDAVKAFRNKFEKKGSGVDRSLLIKPLEKYVGRKPSEPVTIAEQVERFPMLKNAPVEGEYTSNIRVNFNPVGMRIRNVRCARCQQWGHASLDRECPMRDHNPNDAFRQLIEDPMSYINQQRKKDDMSLRQRALPLEMAQGTNEFELLASDDDGDGSGDDMERKFLASLSTKEKKQLLKKLKKESKEPKEKKRKHKDKKEEKKKRHRKDSD